MDNMDDSFDDLLATLEMPEDPGLKSDKNEKINSEPGTSSKMEFIDYGGNYGIQVNTKQKGNPLLKEITSVPWEINDKIIPDYVVGKRTCVLFLSVRYHNLKPDYIHERIKQLGKNYQLRILLVLIDVKESQNPLKHLTRICLLADLTLMLAWSFEEAGKIIESYKMLENCPAEKIQEKPEEDVYESIITALSSIKTVNRTDAMTLLMHFGSLEKIIQASEHELSACFGLGYRKASILHKVFNEKLLK